MKYPNDCTNSVWLPATYHSSPIILIWFTYRLIISF